MLDTTANAPASLPQQVAAHAYHFAPTPSGSRPVWCVVTSQPRAERTAHAELHRRGFEAYLPLLTVRRPNRHYHTGPLFTGYLFVRMRLDQPWNPVRLCPGVYSLLFTDGKPGTVTDAEIHALQAGDALRASPLPKASYWAPGMPCSLATGPFAQHDAVVTEVRQKMALVAVMMFGHLRTVSLPLDCLTSRNE